jgi:hypothetical protein
MKERLTIYYNVSVQKKMFLDPTKDLMALIKLLQHMVRQEDEETVAAEEAADICMESIDNHHDRTSDVVIASYLVMKQKIAERRRGLKERSKPTKTRHYCHQLLSTRRVFSPSSQTLEQLNTCQTRRIYSKILYQFNLDPGQLLE